MDVEFDPAKDRSNRAKHGLKLSDAVELDLSEAAVVADERSDYGEVRYRAFGRIGRQGYCLVFTYRAERIRLISFRRAHDAEMALYDR